MKFGKMAGRSLSNIMKRESLGNESLLLVISKETEYVIILMKVIHQIQMDHKLETGLQPLRYM